MCSSSVREKWQTWKLREWLLALLRFAITLEPTDHAAVLALGDEMDVITFGPNRLALGFFARTTSEVCTAIVFKGQRDLPMAIRQHIERIDDRRLRAAFEAAVSLDYQCAPSG